ncbi:MAG: hypothetical protein IT515_16060 [Burkholderiales bacterium]|nr:hypothetical protein [Burkholderiales bacterium]
MPSFRLEEVANLPDELKALAPALEERQGLKVHALARLRVSIDGKHHIHPWVEIIQAGPDGYVGRVSGILNSPTWHPYGTKVWFTADNIIAL